MTKVQKPTLGRVVIFTKDNGVELPAVVTGVDFRGAPPGMVKLHLLGSLNPFVDEVEYHPTPKPGCWRYPERNDETFEFNP